jgi:GTPase
MTDNEKPEPPDYGNEFDEVDEKPAGPRSLHETAPAKERVILVGVSRPFSQRRHETGEHLDELELLIETAGGEVVEKIFQNRSSIEASTFIGKGKAEYLAQRCIDTDVQSVVFDDDLTPRQQRNLERQLNRKVLDRTALILDIFAMHARTNTAKTQVELAQLEYMLPRLSGMWTHLSKQYGGIGTKGPGETQIETDRRTVRERIIRLKHKLEKIDRQRATQRKSRENIARVALVGYTNVGKSTLLNILTGAEVLVEDKLFATLDSTVRSLDIGKTTILLTDTVGFIRKLPPRLVASFKSTLDEVTEADVLLHVIDVSHPTFREQMEVVSQTLKDIDAAGKPVIMVFNKIDLVEQASSVAALKGQFENAVFISASRGINVGELVEMLERIVAEKRMVRSFIISPQDYRLSSEMHREGRVLSEVFTEDAILIRCEIPHEAANRLLNQYPGVLRVNPNPGDA